MAWVELVCLACAAVDMFSSISNYTDNHTTNYTTKQGPPFEIDNLEFNKVAYAAA